MKILHIIPSLKKGGAERITVDICRELNNRPGVKIILISLDDLNNDYEIYLKDLNFKIINSNLTPSLLKKPLINIDDLNNFIKSFQPDVIHSHLYQAEFISRWILFPNVKYFSHCHDNMFQFKSFKFYDLFSKKRITELYERKIMLNKYNECENNFITISKHTYDFYIKNLPRKFHGQIFKMYNAIKLDRFNKTSKKVVNKKLEIINVGNFLHKKNVSFFIPIAKILIRHGIDFRITLVGDGATKIDFINKLENEGLSSYFSFTGFVDKVEEFLWKSDIYVHTAYYEPFGLVLLEAMAAKLPVVALDGGGNGDIISNNKNGFLIKKQDPEKFANIILNLSKDEFLYNSIVKEGSKTAENHDIKEYVNKLLVLYKDSMSSIN